MLWWLKYLEQINCFSSADGNICFVDGTWISEGHMASNGWVGWRVRSKRQALLSSLSTGLEEPKGNRRRHIIVQIGVTRVL